MLDETAVGHAAGETPAAVAEAIASRDLNNLYLTSCYFTDRAKYHAFCGLYAVMRVVDDRIDAIPSRAALSRHEQGREIAVVDAWREALEAAYRGEVVDGPRLDACDHPQAHSLLVALTETVRSFPAPFELWRNFFDAMERDVSRPRFATYEEFLAYAEGATVAPTTIYLFLIAARPGDDGVYAVPEGFDLLGCGRHLGLFAYLGHILRDLEDDLMTGDEGLLYLAEDDMETFGVTEELLRRDIAAGAASPPVTDLSRELTARSRHELAAGRALAAGLDGHLTPDCAFVLELICSIYEHLLDKLEARSFDPLGESPRLSLLEKTRIGLDVARRVGYQGELQMPSGA